jgi:hypothetical protein
LETSISLDALKIGGDNNLMMAFNEAISKLGAIEIPLSRQEFTWSNKQQQPLLERLDWFFINQAWSLQFPRTGARTMTRDISDHVPCAISIKTEVPCARIFRFENFWMEHKDFKDVFLEAWNTPQYKTDPAMRITAKLKITRKHLKEWQMGLPKLDQTIDNTKLIILFIDVIEEHRDLEVQEWNFRRLLQQHLLNLLDWQKNYWR